MRTSQNSYTKFGPIRSFVTMLCVTVIVFGTLALSSSNAFGTDLVDQDEVTQAGAATASTQLVQSRYQETDPHLLYSGSWRSGYSKVFSAGSGRYASRTGAALTLDFEGTSLTWIGTRGPSCGKARVIVDGGVPVLVDLYAARRSDQQAVYTTGTLLLGAHTVRIEWTGQKNVRAKNNYVYVDAFDVLGTLAGVSSTTTTSIASTTTTAVELTTTSTASAATTTTTTTAVTVAPTTTTTQASTTTTAQAPTTTTVPQPTGRIYYVDATSGNDTNDGLSPGSAWKTVGKVNRSFSPGDSILFKRGEIFRGQLNAVASGTADDYITYGAYGDPSLPKPAILGSDDLSAASGWVDTGANVWQTAGTIGKDVGNLIFNGGGSWGAKQSSKASADTQGDFFYDPATGRLYLYSNGNPGTRYTSIEAAKRQHGFFDGGANYIRVNDLSFKYQGAHGAQINSQGTHHVIIEHCDFAWIGGCYLSGTTRYGNGIELYESCSNITIRYNTVDNSFDEGITCQGYNPSNAHDLYVYKNVVTKCKAGISAYYHGNPNVISGIYLCNNVMYNTGGGWSPSTNVRCGFYSSGFQNTTITDCHFANNIIHTSVGRALVVWKPASEVAPGWTFGNNCYYPDSAAAFEHDSGHFVDFATWKSLVGQDSTSLNCDPMFVDPARGDFRLTANSPCIGAGLALSGLDQPAGALVNVGAY